MPQIFPVVSHDSQRAPIWPSKHINEVSLFSPTQFALKFSHNSIISLSLFFLQYSGLAKIEFPPAQILLLNKKLFVLIGKKIKNYAEDGHSLHIAFIGSDNEYDFIGHYVHIKS